MNGETPGNTPVRTPLDKGEGSSPPRTIRLVPPDDGPSLPNREWVVTPHPTGSLGSQYAILEKIGDGGMGVVYLARDHKLGRHVAIKRLNANSLASESLKNRFFREARAVAALTHPFIVHIYSLGEDNDGPFIVMEYIAGPAEASPNKTPPMPFSLADRVHRNGPLSVNEALEMLIRICQAMDYAHGRKVIHRDLKPSNVLLNGDYEPRIVDFGLARRMNPGTMRLTVPGEKMLSLGYGAPEQEKDAILSDERADVYGLGALLYFSLTGQNPRYFRENDVPEGLRMPIVKALETDREKRWASVKDFAAALQLVQAPSTIEVPTVKSTWRCKWCDTVNPVLIRFCGKCGWDGGETCAECGSEIRVGIQFCGACGADAREYEIARLLLSRMDQYHEEKAFELVVQQAGQIAGFQPTGPGGRRIVEKVHHAAEEAQASLDRKSKLKELIAADMAHKNYEMAAKRIDEYDTLATDDAYASEKAALPGLRLDHTTARAKEAIDRNDWPYAERIVQDLVRAHPQSEEARALHATVRRHRWQLSTRNLLAAILFVFMGYVLSAAPAFVLAGRRSSEPFRFVFTLASLIQENSVFGPALDHYAALWQASDMYAPAHQPLPAHPPATPPPPVETETLVRYRAEYRSGLAKVNYEHERKTTEWPDVYLADLVALQNAMQKRGDFEGWAATTDELERFRVERTLDASPAPPAGSDEDPPDVQELDPPEELIALQATHRSRIANQDRTRSRRILELGNRHLARLSELQKTLTKRGKMDAALAVNTEIRKVKADPEYLAAEESAMRAAAERDESGP